MELDKKSLKHLSKNQLIEIILTLQKQQLQIDAIIEENNRLKRRINQLEKDSTNSSKPPSSDINKQNDNKPKRNQSLRKPSNREPGGQHGHKGFTKMQVDNPNVIEQCMPDSTCTCCGCSIADISGKLVEKRQVVDIPPIIPTVTEFQSFEKVCACGHRNRGVFPEEVNSPVQMGANIKSFLVYLNVSQLIPLKRLANLCLDIFNLTICKRTIENTLDKAATKGTPVKESILKIIQKSKWVGSDETGKRVEGTRWWEWVWQSIHGNYYAVDSGRGYAVVEKHFGEDFQGILIHDCLSAQNNTKAAGGHQQCHPHIQRELEFLIKAYHSSWAYEVNRFLGSSQRARDRIWVEGFNPELRKTIIAQNEKQLGQFLDSIQTEHDVRRLQKRLTKHRSSILRFMHYPDVPFHNNHSEQAIRMAKVKQKISGCFRSQRGAERHATLLSIIETAKKQNINILTAIQKLFSGNLVFQGT